jgi:hypothetical protein
MYRDLGLSVVFVHAGLIVTWFVSMCFRDRPFQGGPGSRSGGYPHNGFRDEVRKVMHVLCLSPILVAYQLQGRLIYQGVSFRE